MAQVQSDDVKFLPGQVIVRAKPLLYCIYADASDKFCATCFKPPNQIWPNQRDPPALKSCGGCRQFRYWSRECQVADWKKFHKFECKIYASHAENVFVAIARMAINEFDIEDATSNPIGDAVYIEASIFDHSCRPNACVVFIGFEVVARAIRPILSNEPVTVSYIDCKLTHRERQMKLRLYYCFTCQCVRCGKEGDGGKNDSICWDMAFFEMHLEEVYFPLSRGQSAIRWYQCFKLHKEIFSLYEKIFGEFHPELTLQLWKCFRSLSMSYLAGAGDLIRSDWESLARKLSRAISVTHGEDHPLGIAFEEFFNSP